MARANWRNPDLPRIKALRVLSALVFIVSISPAEGGQDNCLRVALESALQEVPRRNESPRQNLEIEAQRVPPEAIAETRAMIQSINDMMGPEFPIPNDLYISMAEVIENPETFRALRPVISTGFRFNTNPPLESMSVTAHEYGHVLFHEAVRQKKPSFSWILEGSEIGAGWRDEAYERAKAEYTKALRELDQIQYPSPEARKAAVDRTWELQGAMAIAGHPVQAKRFEGKMFYAEFISPYDELIADVIAVSQKDDPKAVSRLFPDDSPNQLRDFSGVTEIPAQFQTWGTLSSTQFSVYGSHYFLSDARRVIWNRYLSKHARTSPERPILIRAIIEAAIEEIEIAYNLSVSGHPRPSVAETNRSLIEKIDGKLGAK